MIGTGIIFFAVLALLILALTLSGFGIEIWLIAIPILQVLLHFAWLFTFKRYFHRDLAAILTILWLFLYRMVSRVARFFARRKEQDEIEAAILNRPKVAEKSMDINAMHPKLTNPPLSVILGYFRNRPVQADLGKEHTLIAGSTRAGKTNMIRSILVQLCSKPVRKRPQIFIIDLKADRDEGLYKFAVFGKYVTTLDDTLVLLQELHMEMEKRFSGESKKEPVVVIIDEIHNITKGDFDVGRQKQAEKFLSLLTAKAASSGISFIFATQYPRFDVLPKTIVYNLLRKICLPVASRAQAEVIFGYKPEFALPEKPGEFIAQDSRKPKRGRSLLTEQDEINILVENEAMRGVGDDKRLRMWMLLSSGRKSGNSIPGMNKFYKEHKEFGQTEIRDSYRHFAAAGVLIPPKSNGQSCKMAVEFIEGLTRIKTYIADGKWVAAPDPFLEIASANEL